MRTLTYKPLSLMSFTKDTLGSQISSTVAAQIVSEAIKTKCTHLENACPADKTISGITNPRAYVKMWAQANVNAGVKTTWRNTWCDFEGLYSVAKAVGSSRIAVGTVGSAATDGQTTWYGRVYEFCTDIAPYVQNGDIIGFFPEATGHGVLAGDANSFLPVPGEQAAYDSFFINMRTVVANALPGKTLVFAPAQNYSELNSGWLSSAIPNDQNCIAYDDYGVNHTATEMDTRLRALYLSRGKVLRHCEWGDYWNSGLDEYTRLCYLKGMYNVFSALTLEGKMDTFGYWRATDNNLEGLFNFSNGVYSLNNRGKLLATAWQHTQLTRLPIN